MKYLMEDLREASYNYCLGHVEFGKQGLYSQVRSGAGDRFCSRVREPILADMWDGVVHPLRDFIFFQIRETRHEKPATRT